MPLPPNLDLDRLTMATLSDVGRAVTGWLNGAPIEEVALMNRLTEQLGRRRRGCDVGVANRMDMRADVMVLHRQGKKGIDQFGADLAVTVTVDGRSFVKTALFQLKRSSAFGLTLELNQLREAQRDDRILARSFVAAADDERAAVRLAAVKSILDDAPPSQATRSVSSSEWSSVTEWLQGWFSCQVGPPSDPTDPDPVEGLLQRYVRKRTAARGWFLESEPDVPDTWLPCRAWLLLEFSTTE